MPTPVQETFTAPGSDTWLHLGEAELNPGATYSWALDPSCGAVVLFSGTVRDHADGRSDVQSLTYEAYESQVVSTFGRVVAIAREKWPQIKKVAVHHRVGNLGLTESSVLVVVSSPHRPEAFDAGRFIIDTLKETAPIWKKEHWAEGEDWGTNSKPLVDANQLRAVGSGQ